ncbi:hypothetical protein BpHYR1_026367 [Brachionus plicatilis]|uniref:Uncharacterized protein n=1 Tax=Brachionus plicatilis TaxID=10195 RepID=A0A3M7SDC7_BRAPC|nr:hypothetical protein BpHYR1_026367 [Brachionus plicatilis]
MFQLKFLYILALAKFVYLIKIFISHYNYFTGRSDRRNYIQCSVPFVTIILLYYFLFFSKKKISLLINDQMKEFTVLPRLTICLTKGENKFEKNWGCNRVVDTGLMAIITRNPGYDITRYDMLCHLIIISQSNIFTELKTSNPKPDFPKKRNLFLINGQKCFLPLKKL